MNKSRAVSAGKMTLDEAAPLFRSQPPGSLGSGLTKMMAELCSKSFRAYVTLRTKLINPRTAGSENSPNANTSSRQVHTGKAIALCLGVFLSIGFGAV